MRKLLVRLGCSFHKVSGFLFKADQEKQKEFVAEYEQDKGKARAEGWRRYFLDGVHPLYGLEVVFCCWLLAGQRFEVGVGGGRERLNVLGAYCPDDQEYLDIRLSRDNINSQQFVNLLRVLKERHPQTERFILYLDNARYYHTPVVKEWLARNPQFRLEPLPAYSPNLNLIERLWKFLRKEAFTRWHKTFEAMEAAVSSVLDHLEDYREELATLMTEKFQRHPRAVAQAAQATAA